MIEKLGGFYQAMAANSATALDVSGITAISEGGNLKNTAFVGTGTKVNGAFSKKWEVEAAGINTEKDATATGTLYVSSSAITNIATINTPVKVAGTTTALHGGVRDGSSGDVMIQSQGFRKRIRPSRRRAECTERSNWNAADS